jgi:hypothetical protein
MGRARNLLFWLVLVGVPLAVIEGASWGLLAWLGASDVEARIEAARAERRAGARPAREGRWRHLGVAGVIHPYLGFANEPQDVARGRELSLDDLGFVWGGPFVRDRDSAFVLAVFGGSFAQIFVGEQGPERVFGRLKERPELAGERLVVLNTATGGFKQPQPLLALAYLLSLGVEMDMAILIDGFNEVVLPSVENVPQGVFPFYPRSWPLLVADVNAMPDVRALIGEVTVLADLRAAAAERLAGSPARRSRTLTLGWVAFDRWLASRILARRAELALGATKPALDFASAGPAWSADGTEDLYRELAAVWKQSSLQMQRLCRANGIEFHHFLQPNQYLEGSKPIGPEEARVAILPQHPYAEAVRRGYPFLRAAGAELLTEGVSFHDLTQVFAGVPKPLYVDDCCHVATEGNAIVSDAIAEAILQRPALE